MNERCLVASKSSGLFKKTGLMKHYWHQYSGQQTGTHLCFSEVAILMIFKDNHKPSRQQTEHLMFA